MKTAESLKKLYDIKQNIKEAVAEKYSIQPGDVFIDYPYMIKRFQSDCSDIFSKYFDTKEIAINEDDKLNAYSALHCVFDPLMEHTVVESQLKEDISILFETTSSEILWNKCRDNAISNNSWTGTYSESTDYISTNIVENIDFSYFDSNFTSTSSKKNIAPVDEQCTGISINFYKASDNNQRLFTFKYIPECKYIYTIVTNGLNSFQYLFNNFNGEYLNNLCLDCKDIEDCTGLFLRCTNLKTLPEFINTGNIKNLYRMFYYCQNLSELDLSSFEGLSDITDMTYMFYYCQNLTDIKFPQLNVSSSTTSLTYMFYQCNNLTEIDFSSINGLENVTNINHTFYYCRNLESINFGKMSNNADTLNTSSAFSLCQNIKKIICTQNMFELLSSSPDFSALQNVTWFITDENS